MVSYPMRPPSRLGCFPIVHYTINQPGSAALFVFSKETAFSDTKPSRRPKTRQSKNQYPPVEESIPASRPKPGLAGIRRATGGYPTGLTPSLCLPMLAQSPLVAPCDSSGGILAPLWRLKRLSASFSSRFPVQRKLLLLLPWSLTCRKRGNSA